MFPLNNWKTAAKLKTKSILKKDLWTYMSIYQHHDTNALLKVRYSQIHKYFCFVCKYTFFRSLTRKMENPCLNIPLPRKTRTYQSLGKEQKCQLELLLVIKLLILCWARVNTFMPSLLSCLFLSSQYLKVVFLFIPNEGHIAHLRFYHVESPGRRSYPLRNECTVHGEKSLEDGVTRQSLG